jgi:hypothetical protein
MNDLKNKEIDLYIVPHISKKTFLSKWIQDSTSGWRTKPNSVLYIHVINFDHKLIQMVKGDDQIIFPCEGCLYILFLCFACAKNLLIWFSWSEPLLLGFLVKMRIHKELHNFEHRNQQADSEIQIHQAINKFATKRSQTWAQTSEQHVRMKSRKPNRYLLRKPQLIPKKDKSRWWNNYMYNAHYSEIHKKDLGPIRIVPRILLFTCLYSLLTWKGRMSAKQMVWCPP